MFCLAKYPHWVGLALAMWALHACEHATVNREAGELWKLQCDSIEAAVDTYYEQGKREEADSLMDLAFREWPSLQNRGAQKFYHRFKCAILMFEGRYEEALPYNLAYLQLTDTTREEERFGYAMELATNGNIFYALANYRSAYKSYYKARSLVGENPAATSFIDYSLAMVLYRQADFPESIQSFRDALAAYRQLPKEFTRDIRVQEILSNIGLCYRSMEQYDSARYYFGQAAGVVDTLTMTEPAHHKWQQMARAVIDGNTAHIFAREGKLDSAYAYVLPSIQTNLRPGYDVNDGMTALLLLCELHQRTGRYAAMDTALNYGRPFFDPHHVPKNLLRWYHLKLEYYRHFHQWDSAAHYAGLHISLSDSLHRHERKGLDDNVQLAMQYIDNEYQVDLLQKENTFKETTLRHLSLILALVILVVLIIGWSLYNFKKKNEELAIKSAQLETTNTQLQQMNVEKDRILGIVAHDLRTPMGAISSAVHLLKSPDNGSPEEQEAERSEVVQLIETASHSSLELINEILMVANLSTGSFKKSQVSANQFLEQTVQLNRFKALEKRQTLKGQPLTHDVQMCVDVERMRRALGNLIANAVKFSPFESEILVSAELVKGHIRFAVQDQGIGIPPHLRTQLFEPFTAAKREGTNGERPFGLGLSIVRQIMEAHQGRVRVESEEGSGSTFYLELPLS